MTVIMEAEVVLVSADYAALLHGESGTKKRVIAFLR